MLINILKYIVLTIFVGFSIFNAYSADESSNQEVTYENLTSSSVDLNWTEVDGIFFYKINYGLESGENKSNSTDLIDSTTYSFSNLLENSTYYFTVLGYDELGNEGYVSEELAINTLTQEVENLEELYLVDAYMVGKNEVELTFSNPLEDSEDSEREFTVESINNFNDYFEVVESYVSNSNDKKLIIELDGEPQVGEEYKVAVLAIKDKFNQNIENGVDSDATFIGVEITEEMLAAESIDEDEDEEEVVVAPVVEENNDGNAGTDLSADEVEQTVLNVAEDNSKLPKTGPEQLLIFILAFILASLIFVFRFKRV